MEYFHALSLRSLLLLSPFLFGCTEDVILGPSEREFNPAPCQDGDLVGPGPDGILTCVARAPTGFSPKPCLDGQVLTSENGAFKCVKKGTGSVDPEIAARIMTAQARLSAMSGTLDDRLLGRGVYARFLGVTAPAKGRILWGNKAGLPAAAELCVERYPGFPRAHMCTVYEMYEAAATGQLKEDTPIDKAWVYMIGWNNPENALPGFPQEGDAGMNENCASYRYQTAANKWVGTAVAWQPINSFGAASEKTLKFYSGRAAAACYSSFPIACCD